LTRFQKGVFWEKKKKTGAPKKHSHLMEKGSRKISISQRYGGTEKLRGSRFQKRYRWRSKIDSRVPNI